MFNPKLSIITIVYNNVQDIERTLLSVLNQTYKNIEYIVIDGASNDGTLALINKYKGSITQLISEKDKGIYEAMNKGLKLATGDYVLFMNSGDEIFATETIENIFATQPDADIYYGETEIINSQGESMGQRRHKAPEQFTWRGFNLGMSISHQAIYIKRNLLEPYDETYQLSADIDWIIRAAKKAKKIVNTRMYVAKYLFGGMSKKKHKQSLAERFHIMRKHYGLLPTLFNHGIIAVKLGWYYLLNRKTND
jgi:glycosyltransferase involved in cell wall biosynthesis